MKVKQLHSKLLYNHPILLKIFSVNLIEWNKDQHPSKKLSNSSVSLNKISLYHQDPKKIKKIISNLIQSDFIQVLEGPPKIELILTTQNGKIIID